MNLLDLEFLATGCEPYRYPLEKKVMAGNRGVVNKKGSTHTLLNVPNRLVSSRVFITELFHQAEMFRFYGPCRPRHLALTNDHPPSHADPSKPF